MKLTIEYNDGTEIKTLVLEPSNQTVEAAARRTGWQEMVADPTLQRKIELKQSALLALDPNDPERAALGAELNTLQQSAAQPVKNPVLAETHAVKHVGDYLVGLLVDETSVQNEANAFAQARVAEQRAEAATALGLA